MDLSAVRDHIADRCEFPIEQDTLVDRVGDVRIDAPTTATASLETVLERSSETRYRSVDAVYTTVVGNVGEAFVGPKNYDDRAGARSGPPDRDPTTS
ncbi:MAG: hypothetical protein ABEJ57_04590 [Halobacteriaceae archaeon]